MSSTAWIVYAVIAILFVIAGWRVFEKAGEAGWKILIPIYNTIVLLKIVGRPWWWVLLMLIPIVGFVIWIVVAIGLSKSFGHGGGFAVGLIFLPFIFGLILGLGGDRYVGPGGHSLAAPAA